MPDPCAPLTAERRTHLDMELKALGLNRNRISNIILDRFPHTYSRSESVRGMINDWARGARRLTPALQLEIERITKKSLKDLVFGFQETASSPIFETIIQSAATYGNGGETELHKELKRYVADNPSLVGLPSDATLGLQEYPLPSGDSLDVYFVHEAKRLAVEVKSRISPKADIVRGLFQCIKYRAVLCACIAADGSDETADAVLVLEGGFPVELNDRRERLQVRVIDRIQVPGSHV